MAVSTENSERIYEALKAEGVEVVSALPETWLVHLIGMAEEDEDVQLVRLAKEEEGVGVSAGVHLAGGRSAMLMQNHGLLASINGIVSLARLYKIGLVMLVSDRGHFGEAHPWQTEGGRATRPVLEALDIPYKTLAEPEAVRERVSQAVTLADASNHPVALLLTRDLMWTENGEGSA